MKIISINLNNGFSKTDKAIKIEKLLISFNCDLLVVQEPWKNILNPRIELSGYEFLEGNNKTAAFCSKNNKLPSVLRHSERWQEVVFPEFSVHNVYFSWEHKPRYEMLEQISDYFEFNKHPAVICGDFNMAPLPEDGMFEDRISDFTKQKDRVAFNRLLNTAKLIDTTSVNRTNKTREFTIQVQNKNGKTWHRCDLALINENLETLTSVNYDHSVRLKKSEEGLELTDHSAILIEIFE